MNDNDLPMETTIKATFMRALFAALAVCLLVVGLSSATMASDKENTGAPSPYTPGSNIEPDPDTDQGSGAYPQWVCSFDGKGDDVHVSTANHIVGIDASGHGWWVEYFGWCPEFAEVTVQLQQLRCYGGFFGTCWWEDTGSPGVGEVRSGGGSGNRVNGRVACHTSETTAWRSEIDVNLVGMWDDPFKDYTPLQNINCRVYD